MVWNDAQLKILISRIEDSIRKIEPDLRGQSVLTEAASGPYIATPVLAALAGAQHVIACARESAWGSINEISGMMNKLANHFEVADRIEVSARSAVEMSHGIDVVTNLGFVRPITRALIQKLPPHAAIALMWEPWEFRAEDVDLAACHEYEIPIIATNERHPNLLTFKAVGMLALKLLLERQCEVAGLEVVVVGSDPFGHACFEVLNSVGAQVTLLNPQDGWPNESFTATFARADAVVVVEHRSRCEILGPSVCSFVQLISRRGGHVIHICGVIDAEYLATCGIEKHPAKVVPPGFMTLTTAHVGVKPVVDLHAAGLHVASIVARERKKGSTVDEAINKAVLSGYGLPLLEKDVRGVL